LALGIILILAVLITLKYTNYFISLYNGWFNQSVSSITYFVIPLGISYYSLQAIGYLVDIYRGKYEANHNIFKVCLFVSYFPQMLEGPIGRYDHLKDTLLDGEVEASINDYSKGLIKILYGMFLKVVIADRLGILASEVFKNYASYSGGIVLFGIIFFTLELYCEFSGMIEMVTGVSECFGIPLEKNFDTPFFSVSVSEFWRRWHISLGSWFRDYVFYPLSMSKLSMKMNKANSKILSPFWSSYFPLALWIAVIWPLTGLWHGAATKYLVYGAYYGVIMALEMIYQHYCANKKWYSSWPYRIFAMLITFVLVNIGMVIFRASTLADGFKMIARIFSSNDAVEIQKSYLRSADVVIDCLGLTVLLIVDILKYRKLDFDKLFTNHIVLRYATFGLLFFTIILLGAYGFSYGYIDPIYGGF